MKKSYLIGAGILVLVIVIAAFFMFNSRDETGIDSKNEDADNGSVSGNVQGSKQSFEGFLEDCDKIVDSDFKNACYAIVKNDKNYCENLSSKEGKSTCESKIWKIWNTNTDEAILYATDIYATDIYLPDFAKECEDMEKRGITSDKCTYNDMRKTNDSEKCLDLMGEETKDDCFLEVSIKLRDSTLCDSIMDESRKEECISLNRLEPDSVEYCLVFDSELDQRDCLSDLAIKFNNASYCKGLEKYPDSDACYIELTAKDENNYCNFIESPSHTKSKCWTLSAIKEKDESICESSKLNAIEDTQFALIRELKYDGEVPMHDTELCYLYIAIAEQDSSFCEKTVYKDNCYYRYVLESIDFAMTRPTPEITMFAYENIYKYHI